MENLSLSEKTIFIVEDELLNTLLLDKYITKTGAQTIHAKNGQHAVDYCKINNSIDLVLMDIKMPVMDGIQATKLIKKFRNIPIIAQTAYVSEYDVDNIMKSGFDDYIQKPINKEKLYEVIDKYLK